jgi:hypothetical protein
MKSIEILLGKRPADHADKTDKETGLPPLISVIGVIPKIWGPLLHCFRVTLRVMANSSFIERPI